MTAPVIEARGLVKTDGAPSIDGAYWVDGMRSAGGKAVSFRPSGAPCSRSYAAR